MKKQKGALKATLLLSIAGKIQKNKLDKASKNCRKAEEKTLRGILEYAKDTVWGKEHNYAEILKAKNYDDLYARWISSVSKCDYETLRPYIDRHKNGEAGVLFPGKPMMYATTSGTTKEPKWIPITYEYYNSIYNKMTKLWLYSMIMHRPKVFWGQIVSIVGKSIEGSAPDGTVYGSVSGVTQKNCPEFVKKLYSAPAAVFAIADYKARYYTIMRMGIEKNVSLIVTANPSTIVEMQNNVNEFYDDYINDIEKGTLKADLNIPENIRAEIEPYLKPNPERAGELRALKEKYGNVLPKHYWPDMQLLNTWYCGNTYVYLEKFRESFPEDMLHMEFSYFSSECRAGLVMNGKNDTVLFPHMHFFEFIAVDDIDNENPKFYRLHELEVGKRYCIYVSTYAGLYRYDMNDMIEVTGKYGTIPTIKLIQKTNGIVSMTGEKIHESQFITAVRTAEKNTNLKTKFFVGFADLSESNYHFFFEFDNDGVDDAACQMFTREVDKILHESNIEYAAKRDSFRVKDPCGHILCRNSFETYKARCIDMGARDGQFKLNLLMQDDNRYKMFRDLIRK